MAGVTDSRAALAGVTVLDLATFLAAPLCATFLGEFGAEVIKVEQPGVGGDADRPGLPRGRLRRPGRAPGAPSRRAHGRRAGGGPRALRAGASHPRRRDRRIRRERARA